MATGYSEVQNSCTVNSYTVAIEFARHIHKSKRAMREERAKEPRCSSVYAEDEDLRWRIVWLKNE